MRHLVDEVRGSDTNHLDTKTLTSSDGELQILLDLIHVQLTLVVDSSEVDGILINVIEKLAK